MSKTDSGGTTSYKRAGAYVTDSLLKSTVSSTTTDYTPGVSSRVGSDSTFLHSGIKNADTQTDEGGDVSAMRRYDAFGNPLAAWGGWQGPFGYGGPYGYQTDNEHGLMLLGHRYYEADTGRFLTRDPIKDGRSWYGYCGGSPLAQQDEQGFQALDSVRAYCINLWRTIRDPRKIVDELADLPQNPVFSRTRTKTIEKSKQFFERMDEIMPQINKVIDHAKQKNWSPPPGLKGGLRFKNNDGKLPKKGVYREYDISKPTATGRGADRVVIDERSGRAWYTPDHYKTFYEIGL